MQKTIDQLIDESIATLPKWKARITTRQLSRRRRRQDVVERLSFALSNDSEFGSLVKNAEVVFGSDEISGDTVIEFDPDNLERILQIILEYLPQIIQIFLMLFAVPFLVFTLSMAATQSTAIAQTTCVDGRCYEIGPYDAFEQPPRYPVVQTASPEMPRLFTATKSRSAPITYAECECDPCECVDCPAEVARFESPPVPRAATATTYIVERRRIFSGRRFGLFRRVFGVCR